MMKNNTANTFFLILISGLLTTQAAVAGKIKCWRNDEGVKECGTYVPAEHSQKRIETRGESGRVIDIKERAKTKEEIKEARRLAKIKKIEEEKIAEQNKKDAILLKTFSRELDITLLRDSKINVLEGIISVTDSNNLALKKKLLKVKKRAEKKPTKHDAEDIKKIESIIAKNNKSIAEKRAIQDAIRAKFEKDLQRFRALKSGRILIPAKTP